MEVPGAAGNCCGERTGGDKGTEKKVVIRV